MSSAYPEAMRLADDALTLQLELRGLFRECPVVVAHASEWADAANVMTTWVAGMPVVLVREPSGLVRGFVNVCAHRGAVLEEAPSAQRNELVCRHHGWRYGLDGKPRDKRSGPAPLKRVAVTRHGNLLWACLSPPADPPVLPELPNPWSIPASGPAVIERRTVQMPWKRALWERLEGGAWLAPNVMVGRCGRGGDESALVLVEVIPLLQDVCTVIERRWPIPRRETATPPEPSVTLTNSQEAFLRRWREVIAPDAPA